MQQQIMSMLITLFADHWSTIIQIINTNMTPNAFNMNIAFYYKPLVT